MTRTKTPTSLILAALALATPALAQSLNVDIDRASGTGAGVPSSSYGAAAGQTGIWNSFSSSAVGAVNMAGLNGLSSGMTCTKQTGGGSSSSVAGATTDFGNLLFDYMDTTGQGSHVGVTLNGIDPGFYRVYVYAALPGSAGQWVDNFNFTNYYDSLVVVKLGGNQVFSSFCGGPVTPNSFVQGNDYVVGNMLVGAGAPALDIESWTGYTNNEKAALNAFQLVKYTGSRLYVKANATGGNNGMSWSSAFTSLKDALDVAAASGGLIHEIWVAQGTYYPTGGQASNIRTMSLQLVNGCTVYGGFAGTETQLSQRDPAAHVVTLSGNIGSVGSNSDNSYHVVSGSNCDSTAVLDGVTITAGNANTNAHPTFDGGGLYITDGSPTIRNVRFTGNNAYNGAGAYVTGSSGPTFSMCKFDANVAGFEGAGIAFAGPSCFFCPVLKVTNCQFVGNSATAGPGSGVHMESGVSWIVNSVFDGGHAGEGGAVSAYGTSSAGLYNCTVVQNSAFVQSGGLYAQDTADISARNSIIYYNTSGNAWRGTQFEQFYAQPTGSTVTFTYCDVASEFRGGVAGTGNIQSSPQFVDRDGPNNIAGDSDDNLSLLPTSPCVDAGNNALCSIDFADVDADANTSERTPWDYLGQPRFVDLSSKSDTGVGPAPIVDMGAIEAQNPPCPADVDDGTMTGTPDGGVTIDDLLYYLYIFEQGFLSADIDDGTMTGMHDGGVTIDDLLYFLSRFEAGC